MLTLLAILCLTPAQPIRAVLHCPTGTHGLRLAGVRRTPDGRLLALWDVTQAHGYSLAGGPFKVERRGLAFATGAIESRVRGVEWGWYRTGDTPPLRNDEARWAQEWERGQPIKTGGVR